MEKSAFPLLAKPLLQIKNPGFLKTCVETSSTQILSVNYGNCHDRMLTNFYSDMQLT